MSQVRAGPGGADLESLKEFFFCDYGGQLLSLSPLTKKTQPSTKRAKKTTWDKNIADRHNADRSEGPFTTGRAVQESMRSRKKLLIRVKQSKKRNN